MTPEQSRLVTRAAIRDGLLERLPCEVCGREPTHAHHEDYDKPLEVAFLCPMHHRWRHGSTHSAPETVEAMRDRWECRQAELAARKAAA